ncbi:MAG: hypothetical protein LBP62_02245 [Clostridiales bacterium]|nr:hypothetical protein [Clostridiales bacterium]
MVLMRTPHPYTPPTEGNLRKFSLFCLGLHFGRFMFLLRTPHPCTPPAEGNLRRFFAALFRHSV